MDQRRTAGDPGKSARYRLVLADDHADLRDQVRRLLATNFEVLGAVNDGSALIEAAATLRPDAVVCDFHMPGLNGIESGAQILRRGHCNAVIVLTLCDEAPLVRKALREGIRGYVLKEDAGEELIPAIYAALAGGQYLSRGVSHAR